MAKRDRGRNHARLVRQDLLKAAALYDYASGAGRALAQGDAGTGRRPPWWLPPEQEDLEALTDLIRFNLAEIPDSHIRDFVRTAAHVLDNLDIAEDWGGGSQMTLAWKTSAEVEAVLGAYLRGEEVSPATDIRMADEAISDYYETVESARREDEERETAARQVRKAATTAGEIEENADA